MDWIPDSSLGEEHCRDAATMQTQSCVHRTFTASGDFWLLVQLGAAVTLWLSSA